MKPFKTPAPWLAPIRASHLIQLDYYTDTRNFIHIWLPEGYDRCLMLDKTEDRRFFTEGDTLVTTFEIPGHLRLRGEVYPIENGVGMRFAATNLSSEEIPSKPAGVCVQFAAAPSFIDTTLERYFYISGGEIVYAGPPYFNMEENHAWFWGTAPGERHMHNPAPDLPFVGLASKDGRWVAGQWWDKGAGVWGNCHPSISCFHTNPRMPAVAPGQTQTARGVLYLMEGTPKDCVERFRKEFPAA
jgi:hypothetical protein